MQAIIGLKWATLETKLYIFPIKMKVWKYYIQLMQYYQVKTINFIDIYKDSLILSCFKCVTYVDVERSFSVSLTFTC